LSVYAAFAYPGPMADLLYIAGGIAILSAFALYAYALRRI
jgi:hypothetical protein